MSHVVHTNCAMNTHLEFAGNPTGGLYGFINSIIKKISDIKPKEVVICADSKPYKRYLEYDMYKKDRTARKSSVNPDDIAFTIKEVFNFIGISKIPVLSVQGAEADDIIANIVIHSSHKYGEVLIWSNDSDMYQLLSYKNVSLLKRKDVYNYTDFKNEFGADIEPEDNAWIAALTGGHNGLEGIKGVGIKTALKIINGCPDRCDIPYYGEGAYESLIRNNHSLSVLPYKDFTRKLRIPRTGKYNDRLMLNFLASHGIMLTSKMSAVLEGGW